MRVLLPMALAALLIAAGCSKDKDVEPPAVLVKFPATLPVKKLWSEGVGGGKKQMVLRLGLGPAVDGGIVFAASHKGELLAASLDTGRHLWVKKLKIPISAGPGAGSETKPETRKIFNAERKALQVMGLGTDATLETVKAKYKALVKQHHPDANGGDRSTEDRLIEIIKAYNYLKTVVRAG